MDQAPNSLPELFSLKDRVAIVTGGAGLLGEEFCTTLVEAGARVVIADLNAEGAESLARRLEKPEATAMSSLQAHGESVVTNRNPGSVRKYSSAFAVQVDVTQPASVQHLIESTLNAFGQVDILVNSAALDPKFDPEHDGMSSPQQLYSNTGATNAFETYPLNAWQEALEVNLTGAFLCCQAVAAPMLAQGKGAIINLSSIYGLAGPDQRMYQQPGRPAQYKPVYYSVTKWGILGLTQYLATYYAGKNIRVNAISPGGVYNGHGEAFVQSYSARAVMGRMARKDEMNGALLFLASDASSYMTGANLVVDGGWTAW